MLAANVSEGDSDTISVLTTNLDKTRQIVNMIRPERSAKIPLHRIRRISFAALSDDILNVDLAELKYNIHD